VKFWKMTGWHKRKEMMFYVPEHLKSNPILEAVPERPSDVMGAITMMHLRGAAFHVTFAQH